MSKTTLEDYNRADFIFIGSCALALIISLQNGVPWYICVGMYFLICVGINSVIEDALSKEKIKNASKT